MAKPGAPITVSNSYDKDGTLTTTLPRTGVDIGHVPDYWSDFTSMAQQLKNMGVGSNTRTSAPQQAQALAPSIQAPAPATDYSRPNRQTSVEHTPLYGRLLQPGGASSNPYYEPWKPGDAYSPLNPPVALGWT